MNNLALILYGIGSYFLGRYSYMYWRNAFLEEKKKELIKENERLLALAEELIRQDKRIREKWKAMVNDFSKYQACITDPKDLSKWTEMDDVYLNSWHSADE